MNLRKNISKQQSGRTLNQGKIVTRYEEKKGTIEKNETPDETDFNYTDVDQRKLIVIDNKRYTTGSSNKNKNKKEKDESQ